MYITVQGTAALATSDLLIRPPHHSPLLDVPLPLAASRAPICSATTATTRRLRVCTPPLTIALSSGRLADCVSTLWPWSSASALPAIAAVLDAPLHISVAGHTTPLLEFYLVAFGTCNSVPVSPPPPPLAATPSLHSWPLPGSPAAQLTTPAWATALRHRQPSFTLAELSGFARRRVQRRRH
ncbi:hypothetical protein IQ06DRAFT_124391 [Phaeosphaeriaceae sp. SRC1lsM3a]|nr:hypothetical protein IQ06DRAFT_124391 [Stagonospora sp. SRC1lsM3a]